ncbi:MAG: NTP transferase domain-containing protein [Clostridiales bacterium]|nr:NTP transferase domain-containing protein [Clostridiales bacterium]
MELKAGKKDIKYAAVIIAGGYSSRMGSPKPLLQLEAEYGQIRKTITVVERAAEIFRLAGIDSSGILVVLGSRSDELADVMNKSGIRYAVNKNFEKGMFSSIQTGFRAITGEFPQVSGVFMLPVDCILIRPYSIMKLMDAFEAAEAREASDVTETMEERVVYPVYGHEQGHPPLIGTGIIRRTLEYEGEGGLRKVLERFSAGAMNVDIDDPGIITDMDTPEDYEKVLEEFKKGTIPEPEECLYILKKLNLPESITSHVNVVRQVADKIASSLAGAGIRLDTKLISAAALLHDLAKGEENHEAAGAELVAKLGYPALSGPISRHSELDWDKSAPIDEAAILYLADKMTWKTEVLDPVERKSRYLKLYGEDSDAVQKIERRLNTAIAIKEAVEGITGEDFLARYRGI